MVKQFIYGLCDPEHIVPRYVGRSRDTDNRLRGHGMSRESTPKGIWVQYLQKRELKPNLVIIEESVFDDELMAEKWAKNQEKVWIRKLFEEGNYLLNNGCWWKHPDRRAITHGVRDAWVRLHEVYFRLDSWLADQPEGDYNEASRFIAFSGIRSLVEEYPALELAPLDWLEQPWDPKDGW